ncbi:MULTISPECIES: MurR/RpiR family transcriptional regulator [unclassified Mycolicibacterium]|uniref:MurR/RpiR family transcriptional regulator n=2 Tax=unclassified Mycolicibacterium TaxID=2636767 RepID=UPI0012DD756D|nr:MULTISPECIES: MurR/RpiR family transcriptional regulator [unclassified Mycolicibacterium]MUL84748.1 MurR/RpiR family transcriptional regulator [Mycolicibacterium sp. CBMA 329]MUL88523.1 MurR/RpiR family transcriptional regulator [Mycolicibacterium sp. CBMA 331]MUM40170.1 MurR/RpiR family transcriptional regulator [Mycolicibacterium sp. CBMA 247]MUM44588.1 MurR/RpiR family transcriptional regulator [Mycolicibacterium sp. CBMA 294]MUM00138.1 MurR/RpiR family transcriptional regulator [Mycolic
MTDMDPMVEGTVWSRVVERMDSFTKAERKVAVALLANYPEGGLQHTHGLAELAKVSQPTVVRFSSRLGYRVFADLQSHLRAEIHKARTSPAAMYRGTTDGERSAGPSWASSIQQRLPLTEIARTAELLLNSRKRVWVTGGRWSYPLALILANDLARLRPRTRFWHPYERAYDLVDLTGNDVIVILDFRRYSKTSLELTRAAAEKGAQIVLVTDMWISPIATVAQFVLPVDVEDPPFDSMIGPLALCEAIIAEMRQGLGDQPIRRLNEIDGYGPEFEFHDRDQPDEETL